MCTSYARVDLASAELCMSMHLEAAGCELWCLDVYLGLYGRATLERYLRVPGAVLGSS